MRPRARRSRATSTLILTALDERRRQPVHVAALGARGERHAARVQAHVAALNALGGERTERAEVLREAHGRHHHAELGRRRRAEDLPHHAERRVHAGAPADHAHGHGQLDEAREVPVLAPPLGQRGVASGLAADGEWFPRYARDELAYLAVRHPDIFDAAALARLRAAAERCPSPEIATDVKNMASRLQAAAGHGRRPPTRHHPFHDPPAVSVCHRGRPPGGAGRRNLGPRRRVRRRAAAARPHPPRRGRARPAEQPDDPPGAARRGAVGGVVRRGVGRVRLGVLPQRHRQQGDDRSHAAEHRGRRQRRWCAADRDGARGHQRRRARHVAHRDDVGLVGITAGADVISPGWSLLVGFVAGCIVVLSAITLDKFKLDDVVGAVSVHLVCGIWGTLAVGLFSSNPDHSFGIQLLGVIAYAIPAFGLAFLIFFIMKMTIGIRVTDQHEKEGLDSHEHGIRGYTIIYE